MNQSPGVTNLLNYFDPFSELTRARRLPSTPAIRRPVALAMDAYRHGDEFRIDIDMPGVDPAAVELSVDRNILTIRAPRTESSVEGDKVVVAERPRGTFSRQLKLAESLDAGRISASYDRGVLTVTLPVAEAAKPRRVEVTVGTTPVAPVATEATTEPAEGDVAAAA